ncbi:MAG: hypothetical protein CFK52_06930 [Chloracidobacterium sp. CP2_5A]|nr:MAG: hypothetical protein CFK52_06930 [Chloracidobacterium sp. CP2_5A]
MKFRRSCDQCGTTFFSIDRKARFCAKHQPRRAGQEPAGRAPAPPPPGPKLAKVVMGGRPAAGLSGGKRQKGVSRQRQPQIRTLTPEVRARIASAFQRLRTVPGSAIPLDAQQIERYLRRIHTSISQQLWVSRALVSEVIQDLRAALEIATIDLTPEQREQAVALYRRFIETGERPPGGRRRFIAQQLGVSLDSVVLVIRQWAQAQYAQSPTPKPTREQLFLVEKAFYRHLVEGDEPYEELPEAIAQDLGFVTPYQVLRWIDVLYDNSKFPPDLPDMTPAQREATLAEYKDYLSQAAPPERALHATIAEKVGGVTPRQVHKALYDYRVELRRQCLERSLVAV